MQDLTNSESASALPNVDAASPAAAAAVAAAAVGLPLGGFVIQVMPCAVPKKGQEGER